MKTYSRQQRLGGKKEKINLKKRWCWVKKPLGNSAFFLTAVFLSHFQHWDLQGMSSPQKTPSLTPRRLDTELHLLCGFFPELHPASCAPGDRSLRVMYV